MDDDDQPEFGPEDPAQETDQEWTPENGSEDLLDLLWRRSGLDIPANCLTAEYREDDGEWAVVLLPSWWQGERPMDQLAPLELRDSLLVFDPADGWLTPAVATRTDDEDRLAGLLGGSCVRGVEARRSPVQVDPGEDLALLARLAIACWLARWDVQGSHPDVLALLAVEIGALSWQAREWLPDGTAQAWLAGHDQVVDGLLGARPGSRRRQLADLADQVRHAPAPASLPPLPTPQGTTPYLERVLAARAAVVDQPLAGDFDPDQAFISELWGE